MNIFKKYKWFGETKIKGDTKDSETLMQEKCLKVR